MRNNQPQNDGQTKREKAMTMNTAAGPIEVIRESRSPLRGNTTMWLGRLSDGRFVVTSRFQYEIRTKDRVRAERRFEELCRV